MEKKPVKGQPTENLRKTEKNLSPAGAALTDITDPKIAAKALEDSEELYRALSGATFDAVFISDQGICIAVNSMANEMFGYENDELIGIFGTDVIAPESRELVQHNMISGYEEPYEAIGLRKDGTTFHVELRGKMITYKGKQVRVTAVHDIDANKRDRAALRESEERFRTLVEYAPFGLSIMQPDRRFEYFNPKFTEILGYTLDDLPDKETWFEKAYPDEKYRHKVRSVWTKDSGRKDIQGEVAARTFTATDKNGQNRVIRYRNVALAGGKQLLSYEDITSQAKAEKALEESEEKYRQLFENELDAVMVLDAETLRFEDANRATLALFGYSKAKYLALKVTDISAEEEKTRQAVKKTIQRATGTTRVPLRYYRKKDGTIFPGELFAAKFHSDGRLKIIGSIRDITERQRHTETLQKKEQELAEQVKILKCLYGISKLNEQPGISLDDILQETVELVAGAMRLPEIALARICLENQEYKTTNYRETSCLLSREIVDGRVWKGSTEVGYPEERPGVDRGRFSEEEIMLLEVVCERIGKIIQRRQVEEKLQKSKRQLRYLASRLLSAQEEERRRISMELHDDLGQRLTVLKLQIRVVADSLPKGQAKLAADCENILQHVGQTIEHVRRISHDLVPTIIVDLGLSASLKYLFEEFNAHSDVRLSVTIPDIDTPFSAEAQVIIYRIFQEAMTNIERHSRARAVTVVIQKKQTNVSFLIIDDGVGFSMEEVSATGPVDKGLGLAAMHERIRMIDGELDISSRENRGTRIAFTVPIGGNA
jgi:PAS domain S-box-containing protein